MKINGWKKCIKKKKKWAQAFFFGNFFTDMTTSQRCESTHVYLNRFLNVNLSLLNFVKQFFKALNRNKQTEMLQEYNNHQ